MNKFVNRKKLSLKTANARRCFALNNTFYLAHDYVIIIQQTEFAFSFHHNVYSFLCCASLICRLLDDAW